MTLFTKSLWPASVQAPYRRLAIAAIAAPLIASLILAFIAFLVAGMTEARREEVMSVAIDSALSLTQLIFLFTFTFGLIGVAVLWSLSLRSGIIWAGTGALLGAVAGLVFGFLMTGAPSRVIIVAFALLGWIIFLLFRWIAGIKAG